MTGIMALTLAAMAAVGVMGAPRTPNYQECTPGSLAAGRSWCDFTKPHAERIAALLSELTLQEKIQLISPNSSYGDDCNDHTMGVPRIGLGPYMWLVEANTGANSACIGGPDNKCSTTFNGPLGMGASFNRTLWYLKGSVIGTELRAYNNLGWHRATGSDIAYIGVTGFGPNINNPRDPRFGRLSELPSEDPYHAGHYAVEMLKGAQEEDKNGHPKMISFLKHFTAYSRETNRGQDTYNISMYDLFDSYLPQYEIAFTQGSAKGVMCSYNAENGHPSCANNFLLKEVLRKRWNQPDAFVSTDCGVVKNMLGPPAHAPNATHASAWVFGNGTDLEMGTQLGLETLANATAQGLISEAAITEAARRTLVPLFSAGRFDRVEDVEWTSLGYDDIMSDYHIQIRDEAALQSFVLLKNSKSTLPLKVGSKIAVLGPQAQSTGLLSDYYGDQICPDRNHTDLLNCVPTIADAIARVNKGGVTTNATGVSMSGNDTSGILMAVEQAVASDIVVLALGIDKSIEHEGQDRTDLRLPGLQEHFAQVILKLRKPTVLVLTNGGPLAIDNLVPEVDSIVEAFNPGFGARMLAKTLFGLENRWGKLPYTIYPEVYASQVNDSNYDMSLPPGRTYRYYTGKPLFKYGFGMSYTQFSLQCSCTRCSEFPIGVTCTVSNIGSLAGDEVVMVYHQAGEVIRSAADHPVPLKSLVAFDRVTIDAGKLQHISFSIPQDGFMLVRADGNKTMYHGLRNLIFSRGVGDDVIIPITI